MPEQFQCRFCTESYKEVIEFLDHFETHVTQDHPDTKQKQEPISHCDGQENDDLNEQNQSNSNADEIFERKLEHDIVKTIKCDLCEKTFTNSTKLQPHIKSFHGKEKAFKWLRQSRDEKDPDFITIFHWPLYDSVRDDPEFIQIYKDAGVYEHLIKKKF